MYQLPLRYIRLSKNMAVCATRVIAIMDIASYQARETIKSERKNGTLINASGQEATKSAVFLDNGTVIASPMSVSRILNALERSNEKAINKTRETRRLKVYEAVDEAPDPSVDQEVLEIATDLGFDEEFEA